MEHASLKDRSVVIIGGTTGLGLSAAKACARVGANLVVCGRNPDSAATAEEALGSAARVLVSDATDPGTSAAAIRLSLDAFGRFDALYHVAGGSGRRAGDGPLDEVTDDGVEATLRHNLTSLIYSNRAAVRAFLERGTGGSVLNMGSVLGWSPSPKFFATHVYAAAKSAIIGFTKSCAAYYAPQDIRFNVVAPALVDTPMAQRAVGDDAVRRFIRAKQPLDGGRIGRPEDLDDAVVFFLSDASRYVTGQVLAVDGGWTVSEGSACEGAAGDG
jgi:NAD(P)-dependent dehydrogenase (short-subunit alcohol dehydrogenase family)